MDIIRYDGTRFITEEEIDKEFTGHWVFISLIGTDNPWDGGYLCTLGYYQSERDKNSRVAKVVKKSACQTKCTEH